MRPAVPIMPLLIDGYNFLHALGWIDASQGPKALQRGRASLVRWLVASLPSGELAQTTVVFDAADAPRGLPTESRSRGLTVRFAAGHATADDLIEELIRAEPSPRKLVVVSGDHRIQRAARRRKAEAVDCETWHERVLARAASRDRGPTPPPAPERPDAELTEEEVERWMREFGEDLSPEEEDAVDNIFPPGYGEDEVE